MTPRRPAIRPGQLPTPRRPAPLPHRRPAPDRRVTILPRPRPWDTIRRPMTVCIAAIPTHGPVICVSDRMTSDDFSSTEGAARKITGLSNRWGWQSMFSGDPGTNDVITKEITHRLWLESKPNEEQRVRGLTTRQMMDIVSAIYRKQIQDRIRDTVLAPYDLDVSAFLALGADKFGDIEFSRICAAIEAADLDLELLIVGSDRQHFCGLFSVNRKGVCTDWTNTGFCAIGAGAWAALGSLYARGPIKNCSVTEAAYRLLEAKFTAETARSVGSETDFVAMSAAQHFDDGKCRAWWLDDSSIDRIRAAWKSERNRPVPLDAMSVLTSELAATKATLLPA